MVKKSQSPSSSNCNFPPNRPVQLYPGFLLIMQNILQAPVLHILINQEPLLPNLAVSQQGNKVPVLDFSNGLHFSSELSVPLSTDMNQFLDGNNTSVLQLGLVNITKSTRADETVIVKAIGGVKKVSKSKLSERLLKSCKVYAKRFTSTSVLPAHIGWTRMRITIHVGLKSSLFLLPPLSGLNGNYDQSKDAEEGEQQSHGHAPRQRSLLPVRLHTLCTRTVCSIRHTWGQRNTTETRIVLKPCRRKSIKLTRLRNSPRKHVVGQVNLSEQGEPRKALRDLPFKSIIGQIKNIEILHLPKFLRNAPRHIIVSQIENGQIVHDPKFLWNTAWQHVVGDIQKYHRTIMVKRWLQLTSINPGEIAGILGGNPVELLLTDPRKLQQVPCSMALFTPIVLYVYISLPIDEIYSNIPWLLGQLWRNGAREWVSIQIQPYQTSAIAKLRRNLPGEGVITEFKYSQIGKLPNPGWYLAT